MELTLQQLKQMPGLNGIKNKKLYLTISNEPWLQEK